MQSQHPTLIKLSGVSFQAGSRTILSDVNFEVNRGDFIAITGPNGGGKTTLLRIILRLIAPTAGSVEYYSADSKLSRRLHIGYLPQKNAIDSRFPITVEQVISSGLIAASGLTEATRRQLVDSTLLTVDLADRRDSPIGVLSGGQLQRALLGRAIISSPPVLVLDEPLSYLDKSFEEKLYAILEHIASYSTILLVSHEMSRIASMANRHVIVDHTLHDCTAHHHYFTLDCPCPPRPHAI